MILDCTRPSHKFQPEIGPKLTAPFGSPAARLAAGPPADHWGRGGKAGEEQGGASFALPSKPSKSNAERFSFWGFLVKSIQGLFDTSDTSP